MQAVVGGCTGYRIKAALVQLTLCVRFFGAGIVASCVYAFVCPVLVVGQICIRINLIRNGQFKVEGLCIAGSLDRNLVGVACLHAGKRRGGQIYKAVAANHFRTAAAGCRIVLTVNLNSRYIGQEAAQLLCARAVSAYYAQIACLICSRHCADLQLKRRREACVLAGLIRNRQRVLAGCRCAGPRNLAVLDGCAFQLIALGIGYLVLSLIIGREVLHLNRGGTAVSQCIFYLEIVSCELNRYIQIRVNGVFAVSRVVGHALDGAAHQTNIVLIVENVAVRLGLFDARGPSDFCLSPDVFFLTHAVGCGLAVLLSGNHNAVYVACAECIGIHIEQIVTPSSRGGQFRLCLQLGGLALCLAEGNLAVLDGCRLVSSRCRLQLGVVVIRLLVIGLGQLCQFRRRDGYRIAHTLDVYFLLGACRPSICIVVVVGAANQIAITVPDGLGVGCGGYRVYCILIVDFSSVEIRIRDVHLHVNLCFRSGCLEGNVLLVAGSSYFQIVLLACFKDRRILLAVCRIEINGAVVLDNLYSALAGCLIVGVTDLNARDVGQIVCKLLVGCVLGLYQLAVLCIIGCNDSIGLEFKRRGEACILAGLIRNRQCVLTGCRCALPRNLAVLDGSAFQLIALCVGYLVLSLIILREVLHLNRGRTAVSQRIFYCEILGCKFHRNILLAVQAVNLAVYRVECHALDGLAHHGNVVIGHQRVAVCSRCKANRPCQFQILAVPHVLQRTHRIRRAVCGRYGCAVCTADLFQNVRRELHLIVAVLGGRLERNGGVLQCLGIYGSRGLAKAVGAVLVDGQFLVVFRNGIQRGVVVIIMLGQRSVQLCQIRLCHTNRANNAANGVRLFVLCRLVVGTGGQSVRRVHAGLFHGCGGNCVNAVNSGYALSLVEIIIRYVHGNVSELLCHACLVQHHDGFCARDVVAGAQRVIRITGHVAVLNRCQNVRCSPIGNSIRIRVAQLAQLCADVCRIRLGVNRNIVQLAHDNGSLLTRHIALRRPLVVAHANHDIGLDDFCHLLVEPVGLCNVLVMRNIRFCGVFLDSIYDGCHLCTGDGAVRTNAALVALNPAVVNELLQGLFCPVTVNVICIDCKCRTAHHHGCCRSHTQDTQRLFRVVVHVTPFLKQIRFCQYVLTFLEFSIVLPVFLAQSSLQNLIVRL